MSAPDQPVVPAAPVAHHKKKKAPTLYLIIFYKLLKGLLFALVALKIYVWSDSDNLQDSFVHFLEKIQLNPDNRFWSRMAERIGDLTEVKLVWAAVGTLIYSSISFLMATGLWLRIKWIGWLTIGESAFFVPIEMFEWAKSPSKVVFGIMLGNMFVVWYLFKFRDRLFIHPE